MSYHPGPYYPPAAPPRRNLLALSICALVLATLFVLAALIGLPALALLGSVATIPLALAAVCADQRGRPVAAAALGMAVLQLVLALVLR